MSLTNQQLDHLLKLSRLNLWQSAYEKMKWQIEQIIDFVWVLDKANFSETQTQWINQWHLWTQNNTFVNQEKIIQECHHQITANMPTVVFSVKAE
jgi:Asp-tRNA(Asn)/Glu-tRNA(Gln) amidotransferase C subunit